MGACASRPHAAAYGEPVLAAVDNTIVNDRSVNNARAQPAAPRAPVSRRYLKPEITGVSTTADKIAVAFISQAASNAPEPGRGLVANFTSRRHLPNTSARGPAPAAESTANGQAAAGDAAAAANLEIDASRPPDPSDDSFELARAAACRHLAHMQRSCRSSTAAATAWPALHPSLESGSDVRNVDISEDSYDVIGDGKGFSNGGGGGSQQGPYRTTGAGPEATAAEVVPVGCNVGAARSSVEEPQSAAAAALRGDGGGEDGRSLTAGSTTASGLLPGSDGYNEAGPPLPGSLVMPGTTCGLEAGWAAGRPCTDHRFSEVSYFQQQRQTPQPTEFGNGVPGRLRSQPGSRSDMGYYLENERLASAGRAAVPVRHSLLDTPLARQLAAREAEGATHKPTTLEYVPKLRAQPSRGNLLLSQPSRGNLLQSQPSQRQLQPGGSLEDSDGEDGDSAQARRLEYVPAKSASRRWVASSPLGTPAVGPAQQLSPNSVGRGAASSLATPAGTLNSGGGDVAADGNSSRRYTSTSRFRAEAGAGTEAPSAAPSPLVGRRAARDPRIGAAAPFGPQLMLDDPGDPRRDTSTRSSPLAAARPSPASVDVSRRCIGGGPLSPVSPAPLQHRPSAPALGCASPSPAARAGGQSREGLRTAGWMDIDPPVVAVAHAADEGGARGPGGPGGSGAAVGEDGAVGRRPTARAQRLMASLHRLGIAPLDAPSSPAVESGTKAS